MRTDEPATDQLRTALAAVLNVDDHDITSLTRLVGGVSRETWLFRTDQGRQALVLRREPPGRPMSSTLQVEAEAMRAAAGRGVPVPPLRVLGVAPIIGAYAVTDHVPGDVSPRRVLRDRAAGAAAAGLTAQLGAALAGIHSIDPASCPTIRPADPLATIAERAAQAPVRSATFAYVLRWLAVHRPSPRPPVVVHGDFRVGNLIIADARLAAVLDWEAVHVGQAMEDIGWLCMRAWRFGGQQPVGGFGTLADFAAGYAQAGGSELPLDELRWWMTLATVRWGIDCLQLAQRHLSGAERSLELAVIGRRRHETEYDAIRLIHDGLIQSDLRYDDSAEGHEA